MARYLDHTCATPTDPYDTPATAANTLGALLATATPIAAGEPIYALSTHVSTETVQRLDAPASATDQSPQMIISVDNFTDLNPTVGATIAYSGNYIASGPLIMAGIKIDAGFYTNYYAPESVSLYKNLSVTDRLLVGGQGSDVVFKDLIMDGSFIDFASDTARRCTITGLTYASSQTRTRLVYRAECCHTIIEDFDLSNVTFSTALVDNQAQTAAKILFVNGKIKAGTPLVAAGVPNNPGLKIYFINVDSGATTYRYEVYSYTGLLSLDTAIYSTTDPMTDGVTPHSIKLATNANASRHLPLKSEWSNVQKVAAQTTIDVECLVEGDGATALKDTELWLEVDYLGDATAPVGTRETTEPVSLTATGTNVATGTDTWENHGYVSPTTHKLSLTVTPAMAGYVRYRVALAKPSAGVYLNMRQ